MSVWYMRIERKAINGGVMCEASDLAQVKCVPSHRSLVCPHIADGLQEKTVAEIKQLRAVERFVVQYVERFRKGNDSLRRRK
jgi:hypothetical protein